MKSGLFPRPVPAKYYGYAVLLALAAAVARYAVESVLSWSPPYLPFFFATLGAAVMGGLGPGLLASLVGVVLAAQFEPHKAWYILVDPLDTSAPWRFLVLGVSVTGMCEYLLRARDVATRAETLMRESEERFRVIANSAPVMIWLAGTDKQCSWFNDPWLKFRGRTMEQELGNGWAEGVHPEDVERCLETYTVNFEAHLPFTMEFRIQDKDRNWRWVLDRGTPRWGPKREFLGYIGCSIEIEDLKRAEQALQWANADLEQFAFSASHDLREPIRNIAIHTELIASRFGHLGDADGRRSLEYVIQGARRLDMLVNDLLKYTAVSKTGTQLDEVDAEEVLKSAISMLASTIEDNKAEVTHGPLPKLRIREVHLLQIFQNLIGNALKYRGIEPPRIHVSATRTDHFWRMAVGDNGIGIEPRHQQSIFGLFKRLHRAEQYSGSGLGLAICQRIVHLYGGQIGVESSAGRGSTFYFSVPGAGDSLPAERRVQPMI